MKAAIYTPYLETLGGGERYVLSFARMLLERGWRVSLESQDRGILDKVKERFGFSIDEIEIVDSIARGDTYDLCFWLSDGSIPSLFARKNILHFQRPFFDVDGKSLISRMKFFRISSVVVNSNFTKKYIDREFPKESLVIYPPVDLSKFRPKKKKEDLIVYVGRFSQLEQKKRQDVLIEVFKKFYDLGNKTWKLILAGGTEVGADEYLKELKESSRGYPVVFYEKPEFAVIQDLVGRARIFWSASGYGVESGQDPQKMEHFGITVVEAMSAGAVPFVFNGGGHPEIVDDEVNGFLWTKKKELLNKTVDFLTSGKLIKIARESIVKSRQFGYERFSDEFEKLI